VLDDTETATNKMDNLLANTSHGRLTTNLELPLLTISNALSTSRAALVHRITSNANLLNKKRRKKNKNKIKTKNKNEKVRK